MSFWRQGKPHDESHAPVGMLPQVALCPDEQLLQTTFHFLLTRFLKQKQASIHANFLATVLSDELRFCPQCLADTGYYQLAWRFRLLPGCVQHGCHLLDQCPVCRQQIPVFSTPLQLGQCPTCGFSLSQAETTRLSLEDYELTQLRWYDLVFLLSPWQEYGEVRPRLRAARERFGFTLEAMARTLAVRQQQVKGMEARFSRPVPFFEHFVNYLDVLGWSFHELFDLPSPIPHWAVLVQRVTDRQRQRLQQHADQQEMAFLERARSMAAQAQKNAGSLTIQPLAAALKLNSADVKNYPSLVALLQEQRQTRGERRRQQRETTLLLELEQCLQQSNGQRLTRVKVGQAMHMCTSTLARYPVVWSRLEQAVLHSQQLCDL